MTHICWGRVPSSRVFDRWSSQIETWDLSITSDWGFYSAKMKIYASAFLSLRLRRNIEVIQNNEGTTQIEWTVRQETHFGATLKS